MADEERYIIRAKDLQKKFGGFVDVDGISFHLAPGECLGLLGPNGAGKTSTIRMTCGLLAPTQGQARVAGIDVAAEPEKAQQNIGYLSDF